MAQIIHHAKAEIAAIKHPLADGNEIIGASSALDAMVSATETAPGDILDNGLEWRIAGFLETRNEPPPRIVKSGISR